MMRRITLSSTSSLSRPSFAMVSATRSMHSSVYLQYPNDAQAEEQRMRKRQQLNDEISAGRLPETNPSGSFAARSDLSAKESICTASQDSVVRHRRTDDFADENSAHSDAKMLGRQQDKDLLHVHDAPPMRATEKEQDRQEWSSATATSSHDSWTNVKSDYSNQQNPMSKNSRKTEYGGNFSYDNMQKRGMSQQAGQKKEEAIIGDSPIKQARLSDFLGEPAMEDDNKGSQAKKNAARFGDGWVDRLRPSGPDFASGAAGAPAKNMRDKPVNKRGYATSSQSNKTTEEQDKTVYEQSQKVFQKDQWKRGDSRQNLGGDDYRMDAGKSEKEGRKSERNSTSNDSRGSISDAPAARKDAIQDRQSNLLDDRSMGSSERL